MPTCRSTCTDTAEAVCTVRQAALGRALQPQWDDRRAAPPGLRAQEGEARARDSIRRRRFREEFVERLREPQEKQS